MQKENEAMKKLIAAFLIIFAMPKTNSLSAHPFFDMTPHEVRGLINTKCMSIEAEVPQVHSVSEQIIDAAGRPTRLRIYAPQDAEDLPLILFIHGGAWVAGNLETHDNLARYLCKNAQAVVVSVEYQNSPEGKFPVPLNQCYDALQWAVGHTKQLYIDNQVAVVGDSAGGNLSAALCLMTRDQDGPKIDFQVLINPAPDLSCGGTLERQGDTVDVLRWQAMMYVESPEDVYLPYVSPSLAEDLSGLPPTLILLAELDDLRSDGQAFANKLQAANIPTKVYCQLGTNHLAGYGARASKSAIESLDVAVDSLRGVFNTKKKD